MNPEHPRLFLIDGSALAYRAYFAFIRNPLITRKGEHTSAVYGFVNSLLKIMREQEPSHMAVVFDTPRPTFRHKLFPDYKATRAKMPEDMVPQLGRLREVLEAMAVPTLELEGYEADDLIGSIAAEAARADCDAILVSGDKDYMQLVDHHIRILNPKRAGEPDEWLDAQAVEEKFGVPPHQVVDVLALMGDSSDNVPGVAGIGPKTAVKLIREHGSVEGLYAALEAVKAKGVREKLTRDRERAFLSRRLVTIDRDVPVDWSLEGLAVCPLDPDRLEPLFRELEFTRLLREIRQRSGPGDDKPPLQTGDTAAYECVTSTQQIHAAAAAIRRAGTVAIDTETSGLNPHTASLVGISLSWQERTGVYIPVAHTAEQSACNADLELVRDVIGSALQEGDVRWVAHHAKFDWLILRRAGFDLPPFAFDTLLASYLLDPAGRHGLDALALEHLDHRMIPIDTLIGAGKKQISFAEVAVDRASAYAAEDADYTLRLYHRLEPQIREASLERLLHDVEQPLVPVLMDMEQEGIRLDVSLLAAQSTDFEKRLDAITHDIEMLAGHAFNINSTQQLQKVLFEELKLPTRGRTSKRTGFSTSQGVLEELAQLHDLPRRVLEYRELAKLKSTYIDALPRLTDREGRVHTSYNQTVAATGRLSSQDPNLQNIPVRTEVGRQIRKAFVARDEEHRLLAADYSQVELRILAHISGDQALRDAFAHDEDVHRRTAAAVYGVPATKVTPEMRAVAKTANFAIIYGVSAFGLSQQTDLSVAEARKFIDTYFERYPKVKEYMDEAIGRARTEGFVSTLLGRRRFLPEIHSEHRQRREFAERTAINTPIQGTAADLIKVAMISIHSRMTGMRSKMVLQVHDELVFDAHRDELSELSTLVRTQMENALDLDVPLKVDIASATNWLDAKQAG
jgi:DNA polymerase-1